MRVGHGVRAYGITALEPAVDTYFVTGNFYTIHGIENCYCTMKPIVKVIETFEL
jgi:hypothetical protein